MAMQLVPAVNPASVGCISFPGAVMVRLKFRTAQAAMVRRQAGCTAVRKCMPRQPLSLWCPCLIKTMTAACRVSSHTSWATGA